MTTSNYEFYLVLPSNSSMRYFKDNTTTCFTTHLSHEIRLNGEWCVGLAEIHIPCTIPHIKKSADETNYKFYTSEDILKSSIFLESFHEIPYGIYRDIDHFVECLNKSSALLKKHLKFVPAPHAQGHYMTELSCANSDAGCGITHYLKLNEKIGRILGFDPSPDDLPQTHSNEFPNTSSSSNDTDQYASVKLVANEKNPSITGNRPACLTRAIPEHLFIYSDVCEPYAVGDTQASLLRIVSLDNANYKFGATVVKHFAPIKYIPLMKNSFQNIIIDIRDAIGRPAAFEYGTLTLTLHFKRVL